MHASQTLVTVRELGPARLIDRLANHWSHTFEIERSEGRASIPFPSATCLLQVRDGRLSARLEADDDATLDRMQDVVADHLQRMARGEALSIAWTRQGEPGAQARSQP